MVILFLLCAFKSGSDRFYFRKAQGFDAQGKEVFYYFKPKNALLLISFYLNLYLRKLLFFFVCFLPFFTILFFLDYYIKKGGFSYNAFLVLTFASALLFVNGLYYFIRFNGFFFLARYCFASEKYLSVRQLFSLSYKLIQDKKMTVIKKRISFIPWFASCIFLLPVSFVRSHYNRSMAQLAYDLMEL